MAATRTRQLGMVGLGRMGANIVRRLMRDGHPCVVYDRSPDSVRTLAGEGATGTSSLDDFVAGLAKPRAAWVMVPAGEITQQIIAQLADRMEPGDIIIDGGNSYYRDDIKRAARLRERGIHLVDCGTSGGIWGLDRGYCLMIGGDDESVARLEPIFRALAPGMDAVRDRTPGRSGDPAPEELGYLHCGPAGSGHFVKMVHNGVEYALMAAYAEGLNILHKADVGTRSRATDAETAPLRHPESYPFELDVAKIAEVWRRGSVVASWLLDLTASALHASPQLDHFSGRVSDSGEGRWTIAAAIDEGVPTPVLATALFDRFISQGEADFANKLLSAMRKQFGGHDEKTQGD
jgi:6-phosphogluconate dehydrogenase